MSLVLSGRKRKQGPDFSRRQAQAISASINKRFPYNTFGRSYTRRGVPGSASMLHYGSSYKSATPDQREARKLNGYSGRGVYQGRGNFWDSIKSAAGAVAGGIESAERYVPVRKLAGMALNRFAPPIGAGIGNKILGNGTYQGQGAYESGAISNSLISSQTGNHFEVPQFHENNDAGIIISHKEYLADVYGGPDSHFTNVGYNINPGLENSFPWLSQVAANYEEYELMQCVYTYRSTSSDFATANGSLPTIIMATQYNVSNALFSSKQTMMEYDGAMSGKSVANQVHGVECHPDKLSGNSGKYVRTSPVLTGEDLKQYDHGIFQIAVVNTSHDQFNQALGELWVSYTIKLSKPKLFTSLGYSIGRDVFMQPSISGADTVNAQWFLQNPTANSATLLKGQQNSLGCRITNDNITSTPPGGTIQRTFCTITFPAQLNGNFRILFRGATRGGNRNVMSENFPTFTGNVAPQADQYGGGNYLSLDTPQYVVMTPFHDQGGQVTLATNWGWAYELHVRVQTADAGVDNSCTFALNINPGAGYLPVATTFVSCVLDIQEMNFKNGAPNSMMGTSYEATPTLINSVGQIVVPQ